MPYSLLGIYSSLRNRFVFRLRKAAASLAAVVLIVSAATSSAWALAVSEAYVFSNWSSPTSPTGAPFVLNATSGYQLVLNGSGVATSATALSGPVAVNITDRFYYTSHTGTIDPREVSAGSLGTRVNGEISRLDDAGLVNESIDAALNIDFTDNSSVTLRPGTSTIAIPGLIIFEDAGLDPFSLWYCYNSSCTSSDLLFSGFSSSTTSTLLASNAFGTDDYAPGIDQAFWFVFDQPATGGYFRIGETLNFGGRTSEHLEVDFVGITATRARVPEPSTLLLMGSGLLGLPLLKTLRRT